MKSNNKDAMLREYDRNLLRGALTSLFWGVIMARKKRGRYTMQDVADAIGKDKSAISRWFSTAPNWRLDTVADIASALDLDLEFQARERSTGAVFTTSGQVVGQGSPVAPATSAALPFGEPRIEIVG